MLRLPSLSCTLRVFYLPHLNILPKVSLTLPWYKSKKKIQLFSAKVWASGAMRKYWCQLPLQMPAGKKSPLDQTLNSGTLFFLLSFLYFSLQATLHECRHTQQHHTLNVPPPTHPVLTCATVKNQAITSSWHTTKLRGEIHFRSDRSPGFTPLPGFSSHRGTGSASHDWFVLYPKAFNFFPT